jgi:hypothetical protein
VAVTSDGKHFAIVDNGKATLWTASGKNQTVRGDDTIY